VASTSSAVEARGRNGAAAGATASGDGGTGGAASVVMAGCRETGRDHAIAAMHGGVMAQVGADRRGSAQDGM